MRLTLPTVLSALALTSALGCAHTVPTATLATAPVAPKAAAAASVAVKAAAAPVVKAAATTREVVLSPSATDAELAAVDTEAVAPAIEGAPDAPADEAAVPEAPAFDVSSLATRKMEATGGDASAQNWLDPWRPYGIGIVNKTHDTVTLAWRTDLNSRAMVYFGKSFGIYRNGYNGVYHDNNKSTYHQVTIGGLSRFRSYTFTVVGIGELAMQYPSYAFKTRTKLLF